MALDRAVSIAPDRFDAAIFDMDGVVTDSAGTHRMSWKKTFDEFLSTWKGPGTEMFDEVADYLTYVDGRPRYDGVRSFLASRQISLPDGTIDDPPDALTVGGIGNRKNEVFGALIVADGVEVYETTMSLIEAMTGAGLGVALVTSSRNAAPVLEAAGASHVFEVVIGGVEAASRGLPGKPAPAVFLAAAADLGTKPERTIILEDAASGVAAGQAGNFGLVIGVARQNNEPELRQAGADVVVADLAEIRLD